MRIIVRYNRNQNGDFIEKLDKEIAALKSIWRDQVIFKTESKDSHNSYIEVEKQTRQGRKNKYERDEKFLYRPPTDAYELESCITNLNSDISPRLQPKHTLEKSSENKNPNDEPGEAEQSQDDHDFYDTVEELREKAGIDSQKPDPEFDTE